jgi:hypothetical protein
MLRNDLKKHESLWEQFITVLNDEFVNQTGFGIYAHITPKDLDSAYKEFEDNEVSIHHFVHNYVRLKNL